MTADTVSPREQPLIRPLSTDPDAWAYTGFIVVMMQGVFAGYIQSVAVRADCRSRGLGSALIGFAERRILRDTPEEQLNRRGRPSSRSTAQTN